jgi:hypothetical protein
LNWAGYTLIGIAAVALLLIIVPIIASADAQVFANATITVTNSTGTFDVPAFTNSTGTFLISQWVPPYVAPEPVVEEPPVEETPYVPPQPTGSLYIQTYTTPIFPDEYVVVDEIQEQLAKRITIGDNYNLVEDFVLGEATWESTIPKIKNGHTLADNGSAIPTWKNYVLKQSEQKVIFSSNAIGGLVYDLPTCSYSIKENGFQGSTVIPSVSTLATGLVNGEWINLPVNDSLCDVTVTSDAEGIILTSTKSVSLDPISVFNSFNGTSTTIPQYQTFTQVLDVNVNDGIKETWMVWNTADIELGVTQTIHTGATIEIAGNTIDIEALNGQSFNRQYIQDNKAEILQLTDSVHYDFDEGIESLSNVNIIYDDSKYKVNLDYADGGFVNYLEIDPTFTGISTSEARAYANASGSDCAVASSYVNQAKEEH